MNAAFSPSDEILPLPQEAQSARLRRALSELGSDAEFRDGVAPLATLGIQVCHKTIQRVSEAVGAQVAEDQHGALAGAHAPEESPDNPPDLLVLEADGMRLRERVKTGAMRDGKPDDGWRECKAGVVVRCQRGQYLPDGTYKPSEALVQTCLATLDDIHLFGPRLRAEAERKGLRRAKELIALSDAGHGLPGMWRELFPGVEWIVDFTHAAGRLAECAAQVYRDEKMRRQMFHRWKGLLFAGRLAKILKELCGHAGALCPRPECPSDLPPETPERILWTHIRYFEAHGKHMDYPRYRLKGWPISSGHVEAACKRIGNRMKAASKRWTRQGAEAIAAVICDRACGDDRWSRRWPQQIPAA